MGPNLSKYRGCLLGLAVGDAMGYTVDGKRLEQIQQDYGPNGLLGYDLVNGYAEITSYTQLAAFTGNALLAGQTRGLMAGRMAPFVRYIELAAKEWAKGQHARKEPGKTMCWVAQVPQMRRRRCMDTWMLDTLSRDKTGTPEEPVNRLSCPGAVTMAVPVGMFFQPERMEVGEIGRLGAETVALTHGGPEAFLTGAAVAYTIAGLLQDEETPLKDQFLQAAAAVRSQFGRAYPQARDLQAQLERAAALASDSALSPQQAMEQLGCDGSGGVLAGTVYACLTCHGDFDAAMITAVNHSGRSAAVGALTGAILGAAMGEEELPEFYLECLEIVDVMRVLADDLAQGCPMDAACRVFDDDWDRKYIQGEVIDPDGWAEI